ncbi:hypothetical protein QTP88_012865 [Uroleucon formosanum]
MSNQSSVVGSAISIGCNMLHITSQVSRTIIDIVDIPIKNSKCKVVNSRPCYSNASRSSVVLLKFITMLWFYGYKLRTQPIG